MYAYVIQEDDDVRFDRSHVPGGRSADGADGGPPGKEDRDGSVCQRQALRQGCRVGRVRPGQGECRPVYPEHDPALSARMDPQPGDVFGFRDEELGVVAFALKGCEDLVGEVAGVGVFEEGAVWGAFAGGVVAVGGV